MCFCVFVFSCFGVLVFSCFRVLVFLCFRVFVFLCFRVLVFLCFRGQRTGGHCILFAMAVGRASTFRNLDFGFRKHTILVVSKL